jgi:hypothetical protein
VLVGSYAAANLQLGMPVSTIRRVRLVHAEVLQVMLGARCMNFLLQVPAAVHNCTLGQWLCGPSTLPWYGTRINHDLADIIMS